MHGTYYIYRGTVVKGVEHIISTVVQWLRASNILYLPWCSGSGHRTYYIYRGAVVKDVEHIDRGAVVKDVEHIVSTVVQWLRRSNILYLP